MSKTTVYDLESQTWVTVDSADAQAGAAEGRYEVPNTTVRTNVGGTTARAVADFDESAALGDRAAPDVDVAQKQAQLEAARLEAFDTVGDKALTFAEGVVDAASLGFIHQTGEDADLRREVNSGSALVGQLVGTAATLGIGGPVQVVAKGASRFGKAAATALLGEAAVANRAGKIVSRALEEAAIGGALMGSTAFGHQVTDSIIEDKVFAGEAVLHEMGLGAALGFGVGALAGGFSVAASRGAIKGQGGLVDGASGQSRALVDEVKGVQQAWKDAAFQYEARAGVLDALHKKGVIPEEMVLPYREAARRARKAIDALDGYSPSVALDAGPKEYGHFRKAMEEARVAIDDAGGVFMSPPSAARPAVRRADVVQPGEYPGPVRTGMRDEGGEITNALDDMMMRDPEALAAYERLHGRPYEPFQRRPIQGEGGLGGERFVDDAATPTDKTNPGARRGKGSVQTPESPAHTDIDGPLQQPGAAGELETLGTWNQQPQRALGGGQRQLPVGKTPGWQPSSPPGRFSLDDFSDDTLAGEGHGFRPLNRQVDKGDFLNQNHGNRDLGLFPDGHMAPAKDISANAEAFARFREQAAGDTLLPTAQGAPASALEQQLQLGAGRPPTVRDWNVARGDANKTVRDAAVPRGEVPPKPGKVDERTIKDGTVPKGEAPAVPDDFERTYRDPDVPRGEPLPRASRGQVDDGATGVWGETEKTLVSPPKKGSPAWDEFERRSAEDYVEKWYWESKGQGPRINPADEAAVRIDRAMQELSALSGGRLDSAGALEIGERLGLRPTSDMFVDRLDQVWSLRKAAKFAADEARGVSTPLRAAGGGMMDEMARRYMARQGAVLGAVAGGPLGAAVGWVVGKHAARGVGFGAKAASSAGKVMEMAIKTGESLLRGRRATIAARALGSNRPYAYDDEGPISDPIKRIEKIHRVAGNPDQVRATVRNQLGDVQLQSPALASAYEEAAVRQITNLSLAAPPLQRDALGRPVMPTAGALRKFYEFENSTHDLPGLLGSIQRGAITPTQAVALAQQHVAVHGVIVRQLLADPDVLARRTTAELRAMEMILQIPLTPASTDPGHVMRMQASWAPPEPPQGQTQGQAPQAFKITPPPPTPAQSGPRAPGNQ